MLNKEFDEIVFVGSASDRRLHTKWLNATEFVDHGDWIKLVDFMQDARLVMGVGSSMVALAGALKVPSIRVHDYIKDFPDHTIFSNFGPKQWNLPLGANYKKEIKKCLRELKQGENSRMSLVSST
jgi:ADP-heptose:LPS heptosyltransferase